MAEEKKPADKAEAKTEKKSETKTPIWLVLLGVIAILAFGAKFLENPFGPGQPPGTKRYVKADGKEVYLHPVVEVPVGTTWYDPNEDEVKVFVWGHPKINSGNGIIWQVRARYSNGAQIERRMPPYDGKDVSKIMFDATMTNSVGERIFLNGIDYRVEPGQRASECVFVFNFSPP
jgi:hypothetical protein